MFIFEISSQCMFILEKPKVGKSTLQWMLLNMVDPTLSVCVETWWDCMYLGRKALVRMFEKYIHYIGCFVDNCFTTLNVCNQVQLLWLLLQVKHMYIVCLLLRTITLCVFQPSIYLLCVFDFHWNQIVCFSTIDLFTLRVWLSLESNCMFSHLEFDHFVCLSLKMVTLYVWKKLSVPLWMFEIVNVYFVCSWIMFECLRLPIQSLIIHILQECTFFLPCLIQFMQYIQVYMWWCQYLSPVY
jgi:hypothetical protein